MCDANKMKRWTGFCFVLSLGDSERGLCSIYSLSKIFMVNIALFTIQSTTMEYFISSLIFESFVIHCVNFTNLICGK